MKKAYHNTYFEVHPLPPRKSPASAARQMPPKKVIEILRRLINDAPYLMSEPFGSPKREQWEGTVRGVLERGFAPGSSILDRFSAAAAIAFNANDSDEELRGAVNGTLSSMIAVLESAVEQLGWEVEVEEPMTPAKGVNASRVPHFSPPLRKVGFSLGGREPNLSPDGRKPASPHTRDIFPR